MGRNKRKDPSNPVVFLDVQVAGTPVGRILLELFKADVPRVSPSQASNARCSMLDARCSKLDAQCSVLDARCSAR